MLPRHMLFKTAAGQQEPTCTLLKLTYLEVEQHLKLKCCQPSWCYPLSTSQDQGSLEAVAQSQALIARLAACRKEFGNQNPWKRECTEGRVILARSFLGEGPCERRLCRTKCSRFVPAYLPHCCADAFRRTITNLQPRKGANA